METDMQQIVGRIGQSLAESVAMLRNQIEMRRQYSLVLLFTAGRSKDANAPYVIPHFRNSTRYVAQETNVQFRGSRWRERQVQSCLYGSHSRRFCPDRKFTDDCRYLV